MKQAADIFTQELPDMEQPAPQGASSKFKCTFHITTRDGVRTEWTGLTKTRARQMNAYTEQSQPWNVTSFGWEETK